MQKIYKIIISLIVCGLLINLLPFHIFADTSTYSVLESGCNNLNFNGTSYFHLSTSKDTRGLYIVYDNNYKLYLVSDSSFTMQYSRDNNEACSVSNSLSPVSKTVNGHTYYLYEGGNTNLDNMLIDFPVAVTTTVNSSSEWRSLAIYYSYGEGAVDPSDPFVFGDLNNLGFYTKFVNSQQNQVSQMALNKDVISWDKFQDSNGNDLNNINYRVDIQAATVDYEANTSSDLLNQTINDMLTGTWSDLVTISPNVGEVSFTWDEVAKALFGTNNVTVNFWNNLFNVYDSARGVFFKKGWVYRIRLRTYDNSYVGDWQIIYNVTSATPSDSEKVYTNYYIYNYTTPNQDTYDVINNINNINNTENNWYINDTPFDPDSNNSNWLDKLLEFLISLVDRIISFFTNLLDGLLDLILGLFGDVNPAESFFNWFSDLFNGINDIDLTLPQFNLPEEDLTSFNMLVQETLNIFINNDLSFIIWIPLLILIVRAVF